MRVKIAVVRFFLLHCMGSAVGLALGFVVGSVVCESSEIDASAAASKPFWDRPALREKMEVQRAVLVSAEVKEEKSGKGAEKKTAKTLLVEGAGYVRRPRPASFAIVKQFSRWKEMSSLIERSDFVEKLNVLNLEFKALGTSIFLPLKVEADEKGSEKFNFLVMDGPFKGMTIDLYLKDHKRRETEISMTARGEMAKLPGPKVAVEFGAEVALRQMAEGMRRFIESSKNDILPGSPPSE